MNYVSSGVFVVTDVIARSKNLALNNEHLTAPAFVTLNHVPLKTVIHKEAVFIRVGLETNASPT